MTALSAAAKLDQAEAEERKLLLAAERLGAGLGQRRLAILRQRMTTTTAHEALRVEKEKVAELLHEQKVARQKEEQTAAEALAALPASVAKGAMIAGGALGKGVVTAGKTVAAGAEAVGKGVVAAGEGMAGLVAEAGKGVVDLVSGKKGPGSVSSDASSDDSDQVDELGFKVGEIPPLTEDEKKVVAELYMSPVFKVDFDAVPRLKAHVRAVEERMKEATARKLRMKQLTGAEKNRLKEEEARLAAEAEKEHEAAEIMAAADDALDDLDGNGPGAPAPSRVN